MLLYRIARTKWARTVDGEGARLHGGRWNHSGTPCIYTSESRALAILEYTVNTNLDDIPRALSIITIHVPEDEAANFFMVPISSLPGDWRDSPAPTSAKDYGTGLLKKNFPGFGIPSVIIPKEFNFLLNPMKGSGKAYSVTEIEDFVYDIRIKRV
ncbi:RES family NAD+ phosphorylase [Flavitalea sp.]|nr:RES family NAD+ phosphorylase [Flavitalea sp.]